MPTTNNIDFGHRDIVTKVVQLDAELFGGNYWLTRTGLGVGRKNSASFSVGGFIFCTAGFSSVNSAAHESYNDSTNLWTSKLNLSLGVTTKLAGFSLSLGYVGFGITGSNVSAFAGYNEAADTWATKASGITARNSLGATNLNGYGYAVEGFIAAVTNVNERYDEASDSWSSKTISLKTADENAVTSANGYLVSAFGRTTPNSVSTAVSVQYSDASNSWTTTAAASGTVRSGVSGFSSSDIIGVATGRAPSGATNYSDNDRLDMIVKSWATKAPNITSRSLAVGGSINGNGYVIGGQTGSGGSGNGTSNVTVYRNYHLYTVPMSIKTVTDEPRRINTILSIDGTNYSLPVRVRSNGTDWKNQISGINSTSLKTGETFSTAYGTVPATGIRNYEIQIGLPKFVSGLGGGFWITKSAGTAKYRSLGISLNGMGYSIAGNSSTVNTRTATIHQYNDYSDLWIAKASISSVKQGVSGFGLNGIGYSVGGGISNGTVSNTIDKYNDENNVWSIGISTAVSRECGAGYSINGLGYSIGGSTADSGGEPTTLSAANEQYNDSTDVWTAKASFPTPRRQVSAFAVNQMGYACGGNTNAGAGTFTSSSLNSRYNDTSNTWSTMTAITTAVLGSFTFVAQNRGHLGLGHTTVVAQIMQQYDDLLNLWNVKSSSIGAARREGSSFSLNKSGYAACGFTSTAVSELNQYIVSERHSHVQVTLDVSSAS